MQLFTMVMRLCPSSFHCSAMPVVRFSYVAAFLSDFLPPLISPSPQPPFPSLTHYLLPCRLQSHCTFLIHLSIIFQNLRYLLCLKALTIKHYLYLGLEPHEVTFDQFHEFVDYGRRTVQIALTEIIWILLILFVKTHSKH